MTYPADNAKLLIDALEESMAELLDSEEERLENERDFLQAIHPKVSGGEVTEAPSTELSDFYTIGLLSEYFS